MTLMNGTEPDADPKVDVLSVAPPLAPLAMPKQILTRESGGFWRGVGTLLSQLRRDLGRAG